MAATRPATIACAAARRTLPVMTALDDRREQMFPRLDNGQIERIARCGRRRRVDAGEVLFDAGDRNTRFFVVVSGALAVTRPTETGTEELIRLHEPGEFTGEVDVLLGRRSVVRGQMRQGGEVVEVPRERVRELVAIDPVLSDILMRAFILRRAMLIARGTGRRRAGRLAPLRRHAALREFLTRNGHPHAYLDVEAHPGVQELLARFSVGVDEIPVVICRGRTVLRNPSNARAAECSASAARSTDRTVRDVVVVGPGPAGLGGGGLRGVRGARRARAREPKRRAARPARARRSRTTSASRRASPGQELAGARLHRRREKFGAELLGRAGRGAPRAARSRTRSQRRRRRGACARAVVVASGARYRKLDVPSCRASRAPASTTRATPSRRSSAAAKR